MPRNKRHLVEPQMSKKKEFKSVGPPDVEQKMEASRMFSGPSQLLGEEGSKSEPCPQKAESCGETGSTPEEVYRAPNNEEGYYFIQNPYVQQYYTQYMNPVLTRSLSTINSELYYVGRNVHKLANGMKECSDTMEIYATRMLSLQKEMLHALGKTNSSLKSAVCLLREIKEKQGLQGSSSATQHTEQEKLSRESDEVRILKNEGKNRQRSRSGDRCSQQCKRYKEK